MTLGTVLVGLALLAVIAPLVVRPLMDPALARAGQGVADRPPGKQAVLASLRDLDFDHKLGRVSKDDYASTRAELLAQAAEALKDDGADALEGILEEKIRQVRQTMDHDSASSCKGCGRRLMPGDRFCPRCGRAQGLVCPTCGGAVHLEDAFCIQCGTRLKREIPATA